MRQLIGWPMRVPARMVGIGWGPSAPIGVFGRLAGYEDVNDAERLCRDPAMRWVVGDRAISGSAASACQMGRFETKWLSRPQHDRRQEQCGMKRQ
jgi:hypothetical protein